MHALICLFRVLSPGVTMTARPKRAGALFFTVVLNPVHENSRVI